MQWIDDYSGLLGKLMGAYFNKGFEDRYKRYLQQKQIEERAKLFDELINPNVTTTQAVPFSQQSQLYGSIPPIEQTTTRGFLESVLPKDTVSYMRGVFAATGQMPNITSYLLQSPYKTVDIDGNLIKVNTRTGKSETIFKRQPKVKFVKTLDLGDRTVMAAVFDNGEAIVPINQLKGLSPYQREQVRQKAKELGIKIKRLELDRQKFTSEKDWRKYLKQFNKQKLDIEKQKLQTSKTSKREELKLSDLKNFLTKLAQRFNIHLSDSIFADNNQVQDIVELIRQKDPQAARTFEHFFKAYQELVRQKYNIPELPPQPKSQPTDPFLEFNKQHKIYSPLLGE